MQRIASHSSCRAEQTLADRAKTASDDNQLWVQNGYQVADASAEIRSDLGDQTAGRLIAVVCSSADGLPRDLSSGEAVRQRPPRVLRNELLGEPDERRSRRNRLPAATLPTITSRAIALEHGVTPLAGKRPTAVKLAIDHDRPPDARAQCDQQHVVVADTCTNAMLTPSSAVGVVVDDRRKVERMLDLGTERHLRACHVRAPHKGPIRPGDQPGDTRTDGSDIGRHHLADGVDDRGGQLIGHSRIGETPLVDDFVIDQPHGEELGATEIYPNGGDDGCLLSTSGSVSVEAKRDPQLAVGELGSAHLATTQGIGEHHRSAVWTNRHEQLVSVSQHIDLR